MQQRPDLPPTSHYSSGDEAVGRAGRLNRLKRTGREHRTNEEITEPKVRLITEKGAELIPTSEALARARAQGVDLVEIAKGQDIPVVKIIDYGKFKFEKAKREKEAKKKQRIIQVKEIKMGPKIDTGDFERKCKEAINFLLAGDNVKVTIKFRGREMQHTALGLEKLDEFYSRVAEYAHLDKKPSLEGKLMSMTLRSKGVKAKPPAEKVGTEAQAEEPSSD
ncbi:MAG: translation initiation factor IF-3 [Turneriella sp.]|nr:translation initiation factor IF-3 [Turneriella sp.]